MTWKLIYSIREYLPNSVIYNKKDDSHEIKLWESSLILYYIEFKKAGSLYRFDYTGKLVEKVVGEGKACLCEMVPGQ